VKARDGRENDPGKMKMPLIEGDLTCSCSMSKLALMAASDQSNSRCDGFLYSAFAETFRAFRGVDFATRLRWLFDLLRPSAIARGANNLCQNFARSFHRDQSLKQNKN
jgi:hypothetical protein